MTLRRPLIAGNWKMNLSLDQALDLVKRIKSSMEDADNVDVLVAPSFTYLYEVKKVIGDAKIILSAQNMHWESKGAFTGEISPNMLLDVGCTHVILGHSERRSLFGETDEIVDKKVQAAVTAGLVPIVCVGETLEQRERGRAFEVIESQLDSSLQNFKTKKHMPADAILAYEPVWAIGTGKTASPEQAQEVHAFIRSWMEKIFGPDTASQVRILYGGSVKPENAADLMGKEDIDGALIGGASLKAESFIKIMKYQR